MPTPAPPHDPQDLRRFMAALRPHRKGLIVAVIGLFIGALIEPVIPALMQPLLDDAVGIARGSGAGRLGQQLPIWSIPVFIFLLFTVRGIVAYIAQYAASWSSHGLVNDLRKQMFARVLAARPDFFARNAASRVINTISQESAQAVQTLLGAGQTFVKEALTLVALLAYLFWLNWLLTLITLSVLPVVVFIVRRIGRRLQRFAQQQLQSNDELTYAIEENVLAHRMVRLHGAQATQAQRFDALSDFLRGRFMRSVAAGAALNPLTQMATAVALAVIMGIAIHESRGGSLSVGGFAAYIMAMLMTVPRARALGEVYPGIQRGRAALARIHALLDEPPEADLGTHDPRDARGRPVPARGLIAFDAVRKTWPGASAPALDGVSLTVQPGETVALVGASGSGKTTLVNLVPRFVEPDGGSVSLDGVPLGDWKLAALRAQIAMVSQDVLLFNDTVAANVCLGAARDDARVQQALMDANLWEHVQALPQGMDTPVGHNGSQFSGGQRQRLAIARALYRDAPILILDEATSALDTESERLIQQALERLTRGRTTLIVAHRLSTIQHADRVVVLAEGRVVEQGRYVELAAAGGPFARLVAAQSELAPGTPED